MAEKLATCGVYFLTDGSLWLSRRALLFGPSPTGNCNVLGGVQGLSRCNKLQTRLTALAEPTGGFLVEAHSFSAKGLQALLGLSRASWSFAAGFGVAEENCTRHHDKAIVTDAPLQAGLAPRRGSRDGATKLLVPMNVCRATTNGHPLQAFLQHVQSSSRQPPVRRK